MPPEEFYPSAFTDLSERVVHSFLEEFPGAVLIGGWASWARIRALRSHDVDVIVAPDVRDAIERAHGPLSASTHIGGRKWGAEIEGVHVDIYVPYQSRLGARLAIRVEELVSQAEEVEGWRMLRLPAHLVTKFAALLDRPESQPGEKDRDEIWRLLALDIPSTEVAEALRASANPPGERLAAVRDVFAYLEDLALARTDRQRLRELGREFVAAVETDLGPGP